MNFARGYELEAMLDPTSTQSDFQTRFNRILRHHGRSFRYHVPPTRRSAPFWARLIVYAVRQSHLAYGRPGRSFTGVRAEPRPTGSATRPARVGPDVPVAGTVGP